MRDEAHTLAAAIASCLGAHVDAPHPDDGLPANAAELERLDDALIEAVHAAADMRVGVGELVVELRRHRVERPLCPVPGS